MLQKIKHLFAVLLLAGFAAQPALAENFNQDDMAFAFGNAAVSSDLGDMALLSSQEMMETEGEWVPLAIWGARAAWTGYKTFRTYRTANRLRKTYHFTRNAVKTYNRWDRGSFRSKHSSIRYHYNKHGSGRNIYRYTSDAVRFSNRNSNYYRSIKPSYNNAFKYRASNSHRWGIYRNGRAVTFGYR